MPAASLCGPQNKVLTVDGTKVKLQIWDTVSLAIKWKESKYFSVIAHYAGRTGKIQIGDSRLLSRRSR